MKFSVPKRICIGSQVLHNVHKAVGSISKNHGLVHHFYADDLQIYLSFKPTDNVAHTEALCRVESYWMTGLNAWDTLKLNTNKTEVIVLTSQRNAKFVESVSVTVVESNIKASSCVIKNLGAFLDSKLNMEKHVYSISKSWFAQLWKINHIRKYLTTDATKSLVNARGAKHCLGVDFIFSMLNL